MPERVTARGYSYIQPGIEDVVFMTLDFPGGVGANVHISWLDPRKVRCMTVVGSKKMLVYDDTSLQEKIRIYDKGVDVQRYYDTFGDFQFSYRYGDIQIPRIEEAEPLKAECEHFADCIRNGTTPRTDGLSGARVVSVLHAANLSLKNGGNKIPSEPAPVSKPSAVRSRYFAASNTGISTPPSARIVTPEPPVNDVKNAHTNDVTIAGPPRIVPNIALKTRTSRLDAPPSARK